MISADRLRVVVTPRLVYDTNCQLTARLYDEMNAAEQGYMRSKTFR